MPSCSCSTFTSLHLVDFLSASKHLNFIWFFKLVMPEETLLCSADLPMSFEDRVAAVEIATEFQEKGGEVIKMVEEDMDMAKTQVIVVETNNNYHSMKVLINKQ